MKLDILDSLLETIIASDWTQPPTFDPIASESCDKVTSPEDELCENSEGSLGVPSPTLISTCTPSITPQPVLDSINAVIRRDHFYSRPLQRTEGYDVSDPEESRSSQENGLIEASKHGDEDACEDCSPTWSVAEFVRSSTGDGVSSPLDALGLAEMLVEGYEIDKVQCWNDYSPFADELFPQLQAV